MVLEISFTKHLVLLLRHRRYSVRRTPVAIPAIHCVVTFILHSVLAVIKNGN